MITGTSFAVWNYTYNGENANSLNSADISLEFLESNSDIISVTNALPMSDNEGKTQEDVFEFAVTSKTKREMNIRYVLNIEKLQAENGYTQINDENVKIYLTDYNDNPLIGPIKVSELDNYELYDEVHNHNTTNERLQDKYKLRVWIDADTDASSWDENTKLEYKFKIGINSTQSEPKTVSVVVQNGVVNGDASKKVSPGENTSFNLTPNNVGDAGVVSCSSGTYEFKNNTLTLKKVKEDITCNVEYVGQSTVLYTDGTLIINELAPDRANNIETHGAVTNEYVPMSEANSYVFNYSSGQLWKNEKDSVKSVEIGTNISPISTAWWFNNLGNMEKGDFTNLDTSQVTDMSYMFCFAGINATTFNIGDLSNWNTSQVTNMSNMFNTAGINATTFNIDLSGWDTSQVTKMWGMFDTAGINATTFNIGDLSGWDTLQVTDMNTMFNNAGWEATTFNIGDLSNWNTSKVTNMDRMFSGAGKNATTFNIGNLSFWDTSKVTNMNRMFSGAGKNATTFNIGNLSSWDTSQVTNMSEMFDSAGFKANWSLDCSKWNVNKVTSYNNFNKYVESKVTPPVWVN